MRTLHVIGSTQMGGADQFFVRLLTALTEAGHAPLAVTRAGSPIAQALAGGPVRQLHLPLANRWDAWSWWQLRRQIEREGIGLVQTYMGRASRLMHVPAASACVHVARLGGFYKLDGYYRHCDAWIGNTQAICDYLIREGLPGSRVFRIGNFVPEAPAVDDGELARLRTGLHLPPTAPVLFALGRFIDKKGFADLLQALARLPAVEAERAPRLLLAGDGPQRPALEALVHELRLDGHVHFLGWQPQPAAYFRLADALVCPSRHEPLGNVILEGWSHRRPVLSTANEGASELIRDGDNGLICPLADPDGLAAGIARLLALPAEARERIAGRGRATLDAEHGQSAVLARYLELYEHLRTLGRRSR
ncbi:MAG TPA: glycosyltransferase [Plasticicumulans sp.]|nr:glycosyltransferase [Plasticicumulans sp.]